jgi:hypothetical protein
MCDCKKKSFEGDYGGVSAYTILDGNGNKIDENIINMSLKIEKVGIGAYRCTMIYSDEANPRIIMSFKDNNDVLVGSTSTGNGIVYIYFEGNKLRHKVSTISNVGGILINRLRVSELKKISHHDCNCNHDKKL